MPDIFDTIPYIFTGILVSYLVLYELRKAGLCKVITVTGLCLLIAMVIAWPLPGFILFCFYAEKISNWGFWDKPLYKFKEKK